jgi:hypothetical protein
MHRFVVRKALWKHMPLRTRPQDLFEHATVGIGFRPSRPSGMCSSGKCIRIRIPLLVREPNHLTFIADRLQETIL